MKYRILILCLLAVFLSREDAQAERALLDDRYCCESFLELPEVESMTENELHFLPFIPRKPKSKAREIMEMVNYLIDWSPHFFSPSGFLFVQNRVLLGGSDNLFLRGPPCAGIRPVAE